MKRKITKIWGVGLTIVLAASLLLAAAPVSAGTLDWSTETIPSDTGNYLFPDSNVGDIAVSADGVMYSVNASGNYTYKSTNGGVTWSKLTKNFEATLSHVAVAPDDSDIVAVAGNTTLVWASTNGGSTWSSLPTVADTTYDTTISFIEDLAISADDGGKNYIGAAGSNTGDKADVFWFNLGAAAAKWEGSANRTGGFTTNQDVAYAVAFSPNVASDKVMAVVTANSSNNSGNVNFQLFSLSTEKWNVSAGFSSYPVEIQNESSPIPGVDSAAIALAPDYLGSDDSMRVAFVGLNTGTSLAGVYRLKDTTDKDIYDGSDRDIWSIAFDGTNLVAGNALNTKVYRSDNPLATSPDFSTASTMKRPSGENKVVVAWNGSDVVAGTSGTASAFAISRDNGASFNDLSLIDTVGTNMGAMSDVAVSADGSVIYMLVQDANAVSLWRKASTWERVLTLINADDTYIVRVAPEDPDSVYVATAGSTDSTVVYYSQEGGDTKWFTRTSKYAIQDMAVESADVAYVAVQGAKTVSKTTNSGFTWGTEESTGVTGTIHMIRSLGEDKVIVGSDSGYVAYSTDGNSSWTSISKILESGGQDTQATASGLSDGDFIYATVNTSSTRVERWEIGESTSWKDLAAPSSENTWTVAASGIALVDGVLYVQTANATGSYTLRTLNPDTSEPAVGNWSTMFEDNQAFSGQPQSLVVSSGSTKLWSIDRNTPALYSFADDLTTVGPTLLGPRDGLSVEINPVSGVAYDVAFTWERPSKAKIYDLKIALDSGFTELLGASTTTSSTTDAQISEVIAGSNFMPETTYYWRVRVNINGPVKSAYSETRTFTIGELPEALAPVIIQQPPAPVIEVPPAPAITIEPPEIVLPPSPAPAPAPEIVIPPAPAPAPAVPGWALWAIIIIGAVLVIALIVLIMRTRRPI